MRGIAAADRRAGRDAAKPRGHGHADRSGKSWMLPEAKRRDLLYLTSPYRVTIYTFPPAHKVGKLSIPSELLYGECTDAVGDVFIVDANYGAYEYPHGGTTMVASIQNPLPNSHGCAIDPVTGNLAIADPAKKVLSIFRYNSETRLALRKDLRRCDDEVRLLLHI